MLVSSLQYAYSTKIADTIQDVTLAALYVSTKMHDTLKKPQDLLMVSYAIRFPDLAAKSKAIGGDVTMDPEVPIIEIFIR